jgi:two-component system response regulator
MQERTILVGNDDEREIRLIRRAFVKAGSAPTVHFASDGEEVLAHLKGEPPFANRSLFPFPDLLLLDLRMPGLNGLEVLEEVRAHPLLKRLPVIVLSSSDRPKDIALAMEAGANSFLTKPASPREFMAMIQAVRDYWLEWNRTAFVQTPAAPRQRK